MERPEVRHGQTISPGTWLSAPLRAVPETAGATDGIGPSVTHTAPEPTTAQVAGEELIEDEADQ